MSGKQYFKVEYDEEWYLFDSDTISEELVTEQAEYGYGVFANSLSPSEICERLNKQQAMIKELEKENDILEQKLQTRYIVNKQYEEKERLKKENEQLLKENIFLAKQRTYWKGKCDVAAETFEIDEAAAKKIMELKGENRQLRQLVAEYRKTTKHLSELCADASKNGYLPPLED